MVCLPFLPLEKTIWMPDKQRMKLFGLIFGLFCADGGGTRMKPPRFQYCAPRMLDEALMLLDQHKDDCKVLAGGQSLIPLLNMRLANPGYIIDINHLAELHYIEAEDGYLAPAPGGTFRAGAKAASHRYRCS
jgi:xanthine dehydrogenase iron-sulfur cluster and FAD-binding subunit A